MLGCCNPIVSSTKIQWTMPLPCLQDWFGSMGFLTFLREVGKFARVGVMLSRESVKQRLDRDEGISFTE